MSNTGSVLIRIKKKYNREGKESEETVAERESNNNAKNRECSKTLSLDCKNVRP